MHWFQLYQLICIIIDVVFLLATLGFLLFQLSSNHKLGDLARLGFRHNLCTTVLSVVIHSCYYFEAANRRDPVAHNIMGVAFAARTIILVASLIQLIQLTAKSTRVATSMVLHGSDEDVDLYFPYLFGMYIAASATSVILRSYYNTYAYYFIATLAYLIVLAYCFWLLASFTYQLRQHTLAPLPPSLRQSSGAPSLSVFYAVVAVALSLLLASFVVEVLNARTRIHALSCYACLPFYEEEFVFEFASTLTFGTQLMTLGKLAADCFRAPAAVRQTATQQQQQGTSGSLQRRGTGTSLNPLNSPLSRPLSSPLSRPLSSPLSNPLSSPLNSQVDSPVANELEPLQV